MGKIFLSMPKSDRPLPRPLNPLANGCKHFDECLSDTVKNAWRPTTSRTITCNGVGGIEIYLEAIFKIFTNKIRRIFLLLF